MRKIDLTGKRFGRLIVIKQVNNKQQKTCWECLCDCGNIKEIIGRSLRSGSCKSCGCLHDEVSRGPKNWKISIKLCEMCGEPFESTNRMKICKKIECRTEKYRVKARKFRRSNWLAAMLRNTRGRAKHLGLEHDINLSYVEDLLLIQKGKCIKTGIEFVNSVDNGLKGRSPWSLSIDRIDGERGYIPGNIQLVCLMYNLCKNSWGDSEIELFAKSIMRNYE